MKIHFPVILLCLSLCACGSDGDENDQTRYQTLVETTTVESYTSYSSVIDYMSSLNFYLPRSVDTNVGEVYVTGFSLDRPVINGKYEYEESTRGVLSFITPQDHYYGVGPAIEGNIFTYVDRLREETKATSPTAFVEKNGAIYQVDSVHYTYIYDRYLYYNRNGNILNPDLVNFNINDYFEEIPLDEPVLLVREQSETVTGPGVPI